MGFIDNNDIENFTKDGAILCKEFSLIGLIN